MATKIKRILYVGLGGTGMTTLLHTKKMFIDTYGEVPPMIGFLGIDTDENCYKRQLHSNNGYPITIEPKEQLPIIVKNPRPIYENNKEALSWIPQENLQALSHMDQGAGQVRTNGRFAFTVHYDTIARKVETMLADISNARIITNDKYELLSSNTEIHMVFSVSGGTGCGTFVNMAYLLREKAPQCKLTAYAVLPDVFVQTSRSGMAKVAPNAYGAIEDLDYLMHMAIGSKPVKLDYIKSSYEIKDRPFNSVVFIDNKNVKGDTYTHVEELAEMISLALVTAAGELSSASASVGDNIEKNIAEGSMDIEKKKAWAAGMGVCEILYRGQDLSEIYAKKAAINLIDRFFSITQDVNLIANNWIDSPEVNIRENNNYDHVIDYICDKMPKYDLNVNNYANAKQEAEQTLNMNRIKDEVIKEKINDITRRVRIELRKLIENHINSEGGIATVQGVLESIEDQVDIFLNEMTTEKEEFLNNEPKYLSALETACADLSNYDKKFLKTKKKSEEYAEEVSDTCRDLATCRLEITRRTAAITVYNQIKGILSEEKIKIDTISESMKAARRSMATKIANLQNDVGKSIATFQIDLAHNSMKTMELKADEIQISEFVKSLPTVKKLYGFTDYANDEIEQFVMMYTRELASARNYRDTGIDDVLDSLSESEFEKIIRIAIEKSMPLFNYDYDGHQPQENPQDSIFVGVPNKTKSRLFKDDYFKSKIAGDMDVDFSNIGVRDRVIIYHQIGVVPAYALSGVKDYYKKFEQCNVDCHYDYQLETRMQREDFSIYPKKASDEDLLDLWVKGLIFGLVKNEDGDYYFKNQTEGDALDDYWVKLDKYRDEAFDAFRKNKKIVRKEFNEFLENLTVSKGVTAIQEKLNEAKANYFEVFSQINMTKEEVKKKGFEKIRDLITSELNHVKNL